MTQRKKPQKAPRHRTLTRAETLAVLAVVFGKRAGFCRALSELECQGLITRRMRRALLDEFRRIAPRAKGPYWWPRVGAALDGPRRRAVEQLRKKGR